MPAAKLQTPAGPMTRAEIAAHYGIPFGTVCRLLWEGWTAEAIIQKPPRPPGKVRTPTPYRWGRFLTPWGRMALAAVADRIHMPERTLNNRIYRYGWTEEDTFNTPSHGTRGIDCFMPFAEWRAGVEEARVREAELKRTT